MRADGCGSLAQEGRRPGGSDSARMSQGLRAYQVRRRATATSASESTVDGHSLTQGPRGRNLTAKDVLRIEIAPYLSEQDRNQLLDGDALSVETMDA